MPDAAVTVGHPSPNGAAGGASVPSPDGWLANVSSIGSQLPGVLQADAFLARFVAGFDDVLNPLVLLVDGMHSHLDTALAPLPLARWLAAWTGLPVDDGAGEASVRAWLRHGPWLLERRGTLEALRSALKCATGVDPVVQEFGGGTFVDGGAVDGAKPRLVVEVPGLSTDAEAEPLRQRVRQVLALFVPARVPVSLPQLEGAP